MRITYEKCDIPSSKWLIKRRTTCIASLIPRKVKIIITRTRKLGDSQQDKKNLRACLIRLNHKKDAKSYVICIICRYQYLFSVDNYSRFIKIIIDTYFERKYEIKSNLNQAELTFIKLQQITE